MFFGCSFEFGDVDVIFGVGVNDDDFYVVYRGGRRVGIVCGNWDDVYVMVVVIVRLVVGMDIY